MQHRYVYCLNESCSREDRPFVSTLLKEDNCPWCNTSDIDKWNPAVQEYTVFTDGSCPQNVTGGPGGWAAVFLKGSHTTELSDQVCDSSAIHAVESGSEVFTTNNRMEINGVLAAVKASSIKAYSKITICSDSQYCINGFSIWVHNWSKNGWKSGRKEIKNRDLWEEAFELLNNHQHDFEFKWIRGHQGHVWNELADKVAGEQSRKVMLSTT